MNSPGAWKIMKTASTPFITIGLIIGLTVTSAADDSLAKLQSTFRAHCVKCHGKGGKFEGKVNLLALKSSDDFRTRPRLLERLIAVLEDREMPPEDQPPLPLVKRKQMVTRLRAVLRQALQAYPFGPTPIRRMNRFQYNNAVVDLLELDRDIFRLNERLLRRRSDYFRPETRKMPPMVRVSSRPLAKDLDSQRPEGFKEWRPFHKRQAGRARFRQPRRPPDTLAAVDGIFSSIEPDDR